MWQTQAFSALTTRQLYEIYRLRVAVFVVEQTCPYQEVDEADVASLHISKWQGDQLLAYCRLIPWSDGVHLGRVVVQPDARGAGLGRELVSQALATAQQHFPNQPLHAQAQAHLESFYASFGFCPISEVYLEDGIPHLDMRLERPIYDED